MANIVDYLLVGGISYYFYNKSIKGKDDETKRLVMGVGAGVLTAYAGPEVLEKGENYIKGTASQTTKDKVTSAVVGAAAGYLLGDKIMNSFKTAYDPNNKNNVANGGSQ